MTHKFLSEEEVAKVLLFAGSGFASMFANIDIILKVFIGAATLVYLCLKIAKEINERKDKKNESHTNSNNSNR